jgi:hypothetical protein
VLEQAKIFLPLAGILVGGGDRAKALTQLPEFLKKLKTQQKGNEVIAVLKADPREVVRALLRLPGLAWR